MTGVLPRMIRALRTSFPDVDVEPTFLETPEQLLAVRNGKIDFGIARPRPSYPEGVLASVIHREGVVIALSTDHPLARQSTIRARDIAAHRVIIPQFHEEVGLIDIVKGVAKAGGASVPEIVRTADFITAAGLAAAGMGLVVAPRSLTRLALEGLCYRGVSDYHAVLELVLIRRADAPAAVRDVLLEPPE
jgi:DNA-binding transcriptional LysR family regulator